jgi:hypothetical protein
MIWERGIREGVMQCQQMVTLESCCEPEHCEDLATMYHARSGAAMCAEHTSNASKYALDGQWEVGDQRVPYPDGWEPAPGSEPAPPPALEAVHLDGDASSSGLVIERGSFDGLVIDR